MAAATLIFAVLASSYGVTVARRLAPSLLSTSGLHRHALRAANDQLSAFGHVRAPGESREAFARRLGAASPSLAGLTALHLRRVLGPPSAPAPAPAAVRAQLLAVRRELRASHPWHRRLFAALHPAPWIRSR